MLVYHTPTTKVYDTSFHASVKGCSIILLVNSALTITYVQCYYYTNWIKTKSLICSFNNIKTTKQIEYYLPESRPSIPLLSIQTLTREDD
jgi:uncharacterized protein YjhX (UPF0386 family)